MKMELEAKEELVEFSHLKTRVGLTSKQGVFNAIEWSINHNRDFTITTSWNTLGWTIELEVQPDETSSDLFKVFNES